MEREILNTYPDWVLFIFLVGGILVLSLVGFVLVRRFLPHWRTDSSAGVVAAVSMMVMTVFALIMAFSVVTLYQSFQDASANVAAETNLLAEINHDAAVFPTAVQVGVQKAIVGYIREVVDHEFPAMRVGKQDYGAIVKENVIFSALQSYTPKTQAQITFYNSAVNDLNQVVSDRRARVGDADSSLPPAFVALLLLTALLSIATTFFFKTDVKGLEVVLVICVTLVIGAGLLTTLILQFPFSGSLAVSTAPYFQGSLGHLLAQYP